MEKISFQLDTTFKRPCFTLKDLITNKSFNCLYDTGAIITVWCKSEDLFIKTFKPRKSGLIRTIRGIEGEGRVCSVYLIDIKFYNLMLINVPVVVFDKADSRDFIVSHSLFSMLGIYVDRYMLSINTYDNEKVRVYNINSIGNVYDGIALQQEDLGRCPLCGGALSSDGICFNPICEYSAELFSNL